MFENRLKSGKEWLEILKVPPSQYLFVRLEQFFDFKEMVVIVDKSAVKCLCELKAFK